MLQGFRGLYRHVQRVVDSFRHIRLEERNRFASEPVDMLALAMVGLAEEESRENESSAGGSDRIESRCRFIVRRSSTWLSSAGEVSPVFTLSFS